MKIIAHRGCSSAAPENTLAAFKLAWEEGADGIEFDVRQTKDRKVAVIHDETALRTGGRDAKVSELAFWELRNLDVGSWKDPKYRNERIPDLEDALGALPSGKLAMIEIKCGSEILPELCRTVEASPVKRNQLMFLCFHRDVLAETLMVLPGALTIWNLTLYRKGLAGAWAPPAEKLISRAQEAGIRGLGIRRCDGITAAFVEKVHAAGMRLFIWTVDDVPAARRMRELGVDYLATNKPGFVRAQLGD
ncbi:MAG: glycerophosphodiester phosphodiesterase [Verrucomicrobiota bacterium]